MQIQVKFFSSTNFAAILKKVTLKESVASSNSSTLRTTLNIISFFYETKHKVFINWKYIQIGSTSFEIGYSTLVSLDKVIIVFAKDF